MMDIITAMTNQMKILQCVLDGTVFNNPRERTSRFRHRLMPNGCHNSAKVEIVCDPTKLIDNIYDIYIIFIYLKLTILYCF